ncbi:MAG TPA: BrnT family toxin [Rhizomicrobium sp.]|nr:BrnT family toxin [Rhizomicrobium sp.]
MKIAYDPAKQAETLRDRGIDFADAMELFQGPTLTQTDDRFYYGETRFLTYGLVRGRLMMVAWTPRGGARRVISMRKCNAKESKKIAHRLVQSRRP